ncbi:gag-protease polyprotein [Cucumis melo var. makuwa]|uniref:Gag-protease polyprotein n=1 Tax=Cucumis melo var. makuwa TaxID=1194695 RepID=A0A5A7TC39_CUCMM|nr:gag-protease polyprotein [Cucumis melo var. makuwa]TYK01700.1 gag-protease polyprotein [Cucumis melo var. makuwa]
MAKTILATRQESLVVVRKCHRGEVHVEVAEEGVQDVFNLRCSCSPSHRPGCASYSCGPRCYGAEVVPDQLSAEAKHLRDFRKYNPTTFDGSLEDPTRAQLWLSSLETIFWYMKCPEDQKVQCVVFMLTNRGTAWWETIERMLGGDVSQITWQQFKESFYAKFFSASLRDAKRQEFLNLEQDEMTVE